MKQTPKPRGKYILITSGPGTRGMIAKARSLARSRGGPFRAPHHTVSHIGLIGEIAIAACGTLLLDESNAFRRDVIRSLKTHWPLMDERAKPLVIVGLSIPLNLDREIPDEHERNRFVGRMIERVAKMFDGWDVVEHYQGKP